MAGPMAIAGMGATALGGITGAIGSTFQGQAQANMYTYQAGVAQMNAQIAQQNAAYATAAGEVQAEQSEMATKAQIGTTQATQGAGGTRVNSGTNVAVVASEAEIGAQNAAIIRSNAARTAYGYEVEATQQKAQAGLDTMGAETSVTAGQIGAFTSLLGGASSVASQWTKASTAGINFGSWG
jgi:uncharacterized protein (DUF3084 family)